MKLLTDLSPDLAKLIEDVQVDNRGRLIPRLYSKERANKELRNLLNLSAKSEAPDVTKLSDAELIAQLAAQARELGVNIDLAYTFHKKDETDGSDYLSRAARSSCRKRQKADVFSAPAGMLDRCALLAARAAAGALP